jgi:hypothetical protein
MENVERESRSIEGAGCAGPPSVMSGVCDGDPGAMILWWWDLIARSNSKYERGSQIINSANSVTN